ncbi:MAG TPA: SH3 domain-containing protein [Anaerolineales bacterium]|nr:SH3 domain-containing protein [Anaerolineales bacterium]
MKSLFWTVILAVLLTSCNLNAVEKTATPLPTPIPASPTPTIVFTPTVVPIETLLARDTPTAIPTPTSRMILASPSDQPVNCRFGPNISYSVIGALFVGRQAEVIGKSIDETWWYVRNPSDPSTNCWLSSDFIVVVGNVEALPVVSPPEIGVTNISVDVDPVSMNVGCDAFPQTVNLIGQITANGPTIVTWTWETSAGDVFPEETLLFESEGTKEVRDLLTVWSANDYWANLHVLIPNDRSGGANFKVTCVP